MASTCSSLRDALASVQSCGSSNHPFNWSQSCCKRAFGVGCSTRGWRCRTCRRISPRAISSVARSYGRRFNRGIGIGRAILHRSARRLTIHSSRRRFAARLNSGVSHHMKIIRKLVVLAVISAAPLHVVAQSSLDKDMALEWSKLLNAYQRMGVWISTTDSISQSSLMFADNMGVAGKRNVYYCVQQYRAERSVLAPMRDQSANRSASAYQAYGQDHQASETFLNSELPLATELLSTAERISKAAWGCLSQNGIRVDLLLEAEQHIRSQRDG